MMLDGTLDEERVSELKRRLSEDPDARKEFESFQAVRELLAAKQQLPENGWFWEQLSQKLESPLPPRQGLQFIPPHYLPAVSVLSAIVVLVLTVTAYVQRDELARFFSKKSSEVQQAYESGMKGWIMPLFAKTDKDAALEFAMYGTIPLDRGSETVLRVDNTNKDSYRIEVGKKTDKMRTPVSTEELYRSVKATALQRSRIDSLLEDAQKQIESSVLMNANNQIAISASMSDLNRIILTSVAEVLETAQRVKLDRFLEEKRTPYEVVLHKMPVAPKPLRAVREPIRGVGEHQFVVITPDVARMQYIKCNFDSLRLVMESYGQRGIPRVAYHLETIAKEYAERNKTLRTSGKQEPRMVEIVDEPNVLAFRFNQVTPARDKDMAIQIRSRDLQGLIKTAEQIPQLRFQFFNSGEGGNRINIDSIVRSALDKIPNLDVRIPEPPRANVRIPSLPAPSTGVNSEYADEFEQLLELYEEYSQSRKDFQKTTQMFEQQLQKSAHDSDHLDEIKEDYREQTLDFLTLQKSYQKALQEYQSKTSLRKRKK